VDITSAWVGGEDATDTISGTSMATPHVAGVAALYLQGDSTASPAKVSAAITGTATPGAVAASTDYPTPSNDLLFTNY
jgi:subtilisin family serine protease